MSNTATRTFEAVGVTSEGEIAPELSFGGNIGRYNKIIERYRVQGRDPFTVGYRIADERTGELFGQTFEYRWQASAVMRLPYADLVRAIGA